jgi:hypothetical protein
MQALAAGYVADDVLVRIVEHSSEPLRKLISCSRITSILGDSNILEPIPILPPIILLLDDQGSENGVAPWFIGNTCSCLVSEDSTFMYSVLLFSKSSYLSESSFHTCLMRKNTVVQMTTAWVWLDMVLKLRTTNASRCMNDLQR